MKPQTKYGLMVAAGIVFIICISRFKPSRPSQKHQLLLHQVQQLYQASRQDSQILLALVHITSAVAKLEVLATLATPSDIRRSSGVDVDKLATTLLDYQSKVLAGFHQQAPGVALPPGLDLVI